MDSEESNLGKPVINGWSVLKNDKGVAMATCNRDELVEYMKYTQRLEGTIDLLLENKNIAVKTCDRLAEEKIMLKQKITELGNKITQHRDFLAQIFNAIEHQETINSEHPIYSQLVETLLDPK